MKVRRSIIGAALIALASILPTGVAHADASASSPGAELALDRVVHRPDLAKGLRGGPGMLALGPLLTRGPSNRELELSPDLRLMRQTPVAGGAVVGIPLSRGRLAYLDGSCNFTGYSTCSDVWIQEGHERTPLGLSRLGLDFHELLRDRDGDFWALAYEPRLCWEKEEWNALCGPGTTADTFFRDCTVLEFTPTGEVTYRWNMSDHLPPSELRFVEHGHAFVGDTRDPFHCNSIDLMKPDQSSFLISARHTDAVYAVRTSTGGVAWKLGGNDWPGHSMTLTGSNEVSSAVLDSQHDARLWGPNTLSVFDNGSITGRAARGLVFDIRPGSRTAALRSKFEEPTGESSSCTGSFRPLDVRGDRYWLAGWGCAAAGATVFTDNGKPIVSARLRQDAAAETMTNPNLTTNRYSLSYRVIPLVR